MYKLRAFCTLTAVLMLLAIVGCTSSGTSVSSSSPTPQRAVVVSGGNGGGTTIFLPSEDNSHVIVMSTSGTKVCPDCQAAALKYFQTGELEAKCPTCGATRTPVMLMLPTPSHD